MAAVSGFGFLVLGRRKGDWIRIGDNIRICVTEVAGDRVKLAFEAPRDVRILRDELEPKSEGESHAGPVTPTEPVDPNRGRGQGERVAAVSRQGSPGDRGSQRG